MGQAPARYIPRDQCLFAKSFASSVSHAHADSIQVAGSVEMHLRLSVVGVDGGGFAVKTQRGNANCLTSVETILWLFPLVFMVFPTNMEILCDWVLTMS
mgnify:CR=1 FL=1